MVSRMMALAMLGLLLGCSELNFPSQNHGKPVFSSINETSRIQLTTLNCYWFLGAEESDAADKPRTTSDYSLKAGHLIGLLPEEAPLFVGLQEVGNDQDVEALAHAASRRYNRTYTPLFVQGRDTATKQDVGALFDLTQGWGIHGQPARVSELEKELSKHLVVRLTNAVAHMDICVVHLRVPRDDSGEAKQISQNQALLKWAMRHLGQDPKANIVILGDFNEGQPVGSDKQSLAVLFKSKPPMIDPMSSLLGKPKTHVNGGAYDRILLSQSMVQGTMGLKFQEIVIVPHRHNTKEAKRMYTDHFPVSATLIKTSSSAQRLD
ncbi:MAG: endonuclease/exonuclease/phosphatase family protein [Verrucomicrobiales bacterium]